MKWGFWVIALLFSWLSHAGAKVPPHFFLHTTIKMEGFETSDYDRCIIRIDPVSGSVYVLDTESHLLWQYDGQGKLKGKLAVDKLPIEPPVPVNPKVRVTDFSLSPEGSIFLAEMNTASIYEIDIKGNIKKKIQLENSPMGIIAISHDILIVFYQTFSQRYISLLDGSGRVLETLPISEKSGAKRGIEGVQFSFETPEYFRLSDHVFFTDWSGTEVSRCTLSGSSLQCKQIVQAEEKAYNMGFDTAQSIFWFTTETEDRGSKTQVYQAVELNSKHILETEPVPSLLQQRGFQHYNRYFTFANATLRSYDYE